jgi:hypothetical protein
LRYCRKCGETRRNARAKYCRVCGFEYDTPLDNPIGRDVQSGRNIFLPHQAHSTYVIGAQGMGKSHFMLQRILSDLERGDVALCCLDPHGDLATDILELCPPEHVGRIIYFSPSEQRARPFGLNPFEWHVDEEYGQRVDSVIRVFEHFFDADLTQTPALRNTLNTLIRTLFLSYSEYQTTFMHLFDLVQDTKEGEAWRKKLSAIVAPNKVLSAQWEAWEKKGSTWKVDTQSTYRRITNILQSEVIRRIITVPTSSVCFDFQRVFGDRKVLIVNLSDIEGKDGWKLLGSLILGRIMAMGYLRRSSSSRVPLHIYVDEYDCFAPDIIAEMISKQRKHGLSCFISHQSISQVSSEALAAALNCGNKVFFRVNSKEAHSLGREFIKDGTFSPEALMSLPKHEAMVKYEDGRTVQQARITTRTIYTKRRPDVAEEIRRRSLQLYGRDSSDNSTLPEAEPRPPQELPEGGTRRMLASEMDPDEWTTP